MSKLVIEIELDSDDPLGLHSFIREVPWFGIVDGWDGFTAKLEENDGSVRDVKKEANTGEEPIYIDE